MSRNKETLGYGVYLLCNLDMPGYCWLSYGERLKVVLVAECRDLLSIRTIYTTWFNFKLIYNRDRSEVHPIKKNICVQERELLEKIEFCSQLLGNSLLRVSDRKQLQRFGIIPIYACRIFIRNAIIKTLVIWINVVKN